MINASLISDVHSLLQLATRLSDLADSFDKFHETGMEHFKAATSVISQLQGIADICQNDSINTISSSIQAVRDSPSYLGHLCNMIQTILHLLRLAYHIHISL